MFKKIFILIIFMKCQVVYEDVRSLEEADYNKMIDTIKSSEIYKNHKASNYFESFKNKHSAKILDFFSRNNTRFISLFIPKFLDFYTKMLSDILNSIMNREYDQMLFKLICKTKIDNDYHIGAISCASIHASLTILEILDFLYNKEYITNNSYQWRDDKKELFTFLYHDICSSTAFFSAEIQEFDVSFFENLWEVAYLRNIESLFTQFISIYKLVPSHLENLELYCFKKQFYFHSTINEVIGSYKYSRITNFLSNVHYYSRNQRNTFYVLLDYDGCLKNRISWHPFKKPFYNEGILIDSEEKFNRSPKLKDKLNLDFLKEKTLSCQDKSEFEFIMGLLQHHTEAQMLKIICIYYKDSFKIKIVDIIDGIKCLLKYYKLSNNITKKCIRELTGNTKKYEDSHFRTINDSKDYYFLQRKGCKKFSNSKCLKLSCDHIIGKELLEEFFRFDEMRCFLCNIEVRIIGYLEIDLYLKLEDE